MLFALISDGLLLFIAAGAIALGLLMGWRRMTDGTHRVKHLFRALLLGLFVAFLAAFWRDPRSGRTALWATPDWQNATVSERTQWRIIAGGVGLICYMLPAVVALALTWKRVSEHPETEIDRSSDGD